MQVPGFPYGKEKTEVMGLSIKTTGVSLWRV